MPVCPNRPWISAVDLVFLGFCRVRFCSGLVRLVVDMVMGSWVPFDFGVVRVDSELCIRT